MVATPLTSWTGSQTTMSARLAVVAIAWSLVDGVRADKLWGLFELYQDTRCLVLFSRFVCTIQKTHLVNSKRHTALGTRVFVGDRYNFVHVLKIDASIKP